MAPSQTHAVSLHPVVGHEGIRQTLMTAHAGGVLPSALLLHGTKGVGKQHLALWLARMVVCDSPKDGPCDVCGPCRMAASHQHPDIHWYFPLGRPKNATGTRLTDALETARQHRLAEIRADPLRPSWSDEVEGLYLGTVRNIRSRAHMRPAMAHGQIFIIGQADRLVPQESSPEAANALLKLLEEPPGTTRFILTSSAPGLLLPTIRSRTVPLHVGRLTREQVMVFLERHATVDDERAGWAATLAQGSPGRALGFLPEDDERGPLEALRRRAFELVIAATERGVSPGYATAISFPPSGARRLTDLFSFVEEWLRDLAATAAGADDSVFNRDALAHLQKHLRAHPISAGDVPAAFTAVEHARELASGNVNPQLVVSALVRDLRHALSINAEPGAVVP